MVEITLSNETVQFINMATSVTKAQIIDCIVEDDRVTFVVEKGQLGLAIGSKAKNLEKLRSLLKKSVKFVEYDANVERFIQNLCKPYKIKAIQLDEANSEFTAKIQVNPADKSKLIGKQGKNINIIRQLAQRHHPVKDVQII